MSPQDEIDLWNAYEKLDHAFLVKDDKLVEDTLAEILMIRNKDGRDSSETG